MNDPNEELVEAFRAMGIVHEPLKGVRGRRAQKWSELPDAYLQRVRRLMGNDAPESLLEELRKRGLTDAA